jgi:very-short-patch-repair endonuclease
MSLPERLLWRGLRNSPAGIRFRRQHPAGPYVVDFFCARANLAIEVDGSIHASEEQRAHDARRDAWMKERRIETLRIPAREVLADAESVAQSVFALCHERLIAFGKTPPSDARASATSPSQVDGEIKEEP